MQIKCPISVLLTTVLHINSSVCSSFHLHSYTCLFVDVTCMCSTRWGQCVTAVMPSPRAAWCSAHHRKTLPACWDWNKRLFWSIILSYCIHQGEQREDGHKHSHIRRIIHAGCGFSALSFPLFFTATLRVPSVIWIVSLVLLTYVLLSCAASCLPTDNQMFAWVGATASQQIAVVLLFCCCFFAVHYFCLF